MPCDVIERDGKIAGFVCSRCSRGPRRRPCAYCGRPYEVLCDGAAYDCTRCVARRVGADHTCAVGAMAGDSPFAALALCPAGTCDTPMCRSCAHHVEPNKDFCRKHRPQERMVTA